jgi:hypothetical protein
MGQDSICPDLQVLIDLTHPSLQDAVPGALHPAAFAVDGFVRSIRDGIGDICPNNQRVFLAIDVGRLSGSTDSRCLRPSFVFAILPFWHFGIFADHNIPDS